MLVQRGETALTGTTKTATITLDTPVPVGKSFPLTSTRGSARTKDGAVTAILGGVVDNNYTTLTFQRADTSMSVTIVWQVISGDEFTVQTGTVTMAVADKIKAVTISKVDLTKTFAVVTTRMGALSSDPGSIDKLTRVRAELISDTSLSLTRCDKDYGNFTGAVTVWYVVTMDGATVQQYTDTILDTGTEKSVTIENIDLTRTLIIQTWEYNGNTAYANSWPTAKFTDASTILLQCYGAITDVKVTGFVISHPQFAVTAGTTVLAAGTTTAQETISIDDLTRAFSVGTVKANDTDRVFQYINTSHTLDAENLNFARDYDYGESSETSWFVVEWLDTIPPLNLRPDKVAIMPQEDTAFTWSKSPIVNAIAYEWGYREPLGEWQDTGKIESTAQKHVTPAGTFELGKDYEWHVRHWSDRTTEPSSWTTATFNTSTPVIQNPTPWPDSSVRVDILQFGGRVKSPYGRDVQLTIEIASDADFTSPTTYALPAVESGEVAIVDHAVTEGGTWYIRMTATDTESLQTVLVYSFFAGQFLLFVDAPNVQTQAPQATHVTVRVKGTTTEYTAVITPAPPPEKVIERLIEIESGTVAQCQEVAERLLERWGREQRSISGVVDLIVTLKYQQKVRVKHPQAGIDEELILQKKEHDVLGSQTTHVTLGDIILSDDELLARVLDELVG